MTWLAPSGHRRCQIPPEVIGTSTESWEAATRHAVETAAKTLRDLRVGEVVKLDVTVEDGRVTHYRARVNISFKYESD